MHIAQLNIARALAPLDDPLMAEFVDNLEHINGLAEQAPGYVWRLQDESGDATSIQVFDDPLVIVNLSVWRNIETLKDFVFRTQHLHFLKNKGQWFEKAPQATTVMWWIDEGHLPSVEEAVAKLNRLREQGDSAEAFGFGSRFAKSSSGD